MKKLLLGASIALCLLSLLPPAFSQVAGPVVAADTLTLSGKVLDKRTGRPIPYATIGIEGKAIGTISNQEGQFDFYLPGGKQSDVVFVSCIGYVRFKATVGALLSGQALIELEPATYTLQDAVVKGKKGLTAEQIVRKARQKITDNYPVAPYKLEAYYRKHQKVNGRYVYFTDAALEIYDQGYQHLPAKFSQREQVVLRETRQSHYRNPIPYENALDREIRYYIESVITSRKRLIFSRFRRGENCLFQSFSPNRAAKSINNTVFSGHLRRSVQRWYWLTY